MRSILSTMLLVATLPLFQACGMNILAQTEQKDAAEDATLELEARNATKAIAILEAALAKDAGNTQLLSILSSAYAQRAGIEPLSFAQSVGNSGGDSSSDSSSGGDLTSMFGLVPDVTSESLSDIERACEIIITDIPQAARTRSDLFKLALYQTAAIVMRTKALDLDGDGVLEPEEILDLSSTDATGLLGQLAQASSLFANDAGNASSEAAGKTIDEIRAKIDAAPGETEDERLRNYLAGASAFTANAHSRFD